jgi:hypothetical protein
MNRVKALLLAATGAAVVLSLVGCGAAPITGAEPGATLAGPIELVREGKNGTIGGGDLEITVSDDGTGITEASLKLSDMSCSNESGSIRVESGGWSTTTKYVRPAPITDGRFDFKIGNGGDVVSITGSFDAPSKVNANIEISGTQKPPQGQAFDCDYGSWSWRGAKQ